MNDFFKGKKLLVVGGTSGMGLGNSSPVLEVGRERGYHRQ